MWGRLLIVLPLGRVLQVVALAMVVMVTSAGAARAAAPTAPPTVLASPSGTVDEKTPITFRIRASAEDQQFGHWAVLISSGNDEILELKPTSDPAVYERTIKLHNQRQYAAVHEDDSPDFTAPELSSRIFPGTVTWRVTFFPDSKPSRLGDKSTRTATEKFEFKATFERRDHVGKPRLPTLRSHRIVPNKSLAGVALNDRRSHVLKLFGSSFFGEEMLFDRTDTWARGTVVNGKPHATGDVLDIEFDQDNVGLMEVLRPNKNPGGLGNLKTPKGIGLGSKRKALLKAYPNMEPLEQEDPGDPEGYRLAGRDLTETVFVLSGKHKVNQILMR